MFKAELNYWKRLGRTKQYPIKYDENGNYLSGGGYYEDQTSEIVSQETISGGSEIEVFEQFCRLNNALRFWNGVYYNFVEKEWEDKYNEWLKSDDYKRKSFDLLYGNEIAD